MKMTYVTSHFRFSFSSGFLFLLFLMPNTGTKDESAPHVGYYNGDCRVVESLFAVESSSEEEGGRGKNPETC